MPLSPKYAISNGFAIGSLPDNLWGGTTAIEKMFVILSIPECTIETIKSEGGQKILRSHGMTFVNDPGPPASMLPRDIDDVSSF